MPDRRLLASAGRRFFSSRVSFLDDGAASVTPFSAADAQGIGNAVALHKS